MLVYDLIPPEGRCVSPHGHSLVENTVLCSVIPESAFCPTCGKEWAIVVTPEESG